MCSENSKSKDISDKDDKSEDLFSENYSNKETMFRRKKESTSVQPFIDDSAFPEEDDDSNTHRLQTALFIFNILLGLISGALLALGVITIVNAPLKMDRDGAYWLLHAASVALIIIGVICFIGSLFGCFGSVKKIKCLLIFQIVLFSVLALVCLGILGLVIYTWVTIGGSTSQLKENMYKSLSNYGRASSDSTSVYDRFWDYMQQKLECCGVENYKDWADENSFYVITSLQLFPESCCTRNSNGEIKDSCTAGLEQDSFYSDGCFQKLMTYMEEKALIAVCFLSIGTIALIISIILASIIVCRK